MTHRQAVDLWNMYREIATLKILGAVKMVGGPGLEVAALLPDDCIMDKHADAADRDAAAAWLREWADALEGK